MSCLKHITDKLYSHKDLPPEHYIRDLLAYCKLICEQVYPVNSVILFGSLVKGSFKKELSDIDLLVVFDNLPKTYHDRIVFKRENLSHRPSGIQAHWFTKQEISDNFEGRAGFILDALLEGWFLLDKEDYVINFKNKLLEMIEARKIIKEKNNWAWPMPNNELQVIDL